MNELEHAYTACWCCFLLADTTRGSHAQLLPLYRPPAPAQAMGTASGAPTASLICDLAWLLVPTTLAVGLCTSISADSWGTYLER